MVFFRGPHLYIPSEDGYSKEIPLPFSKLHKIAMEEVFRGYLKQDAKGHWQINEGFFGDLTSNAWYDNRIFIPKTQADWDSIYLKIVAENWKNQDLRTTTEIKRDNETAEAAMQRTKSLDSTFKEQKRRNTLWYKIGHLFNNL